MTDNIENSIDTSLALKIEKAAQTQEKLRTTWGRGIKRTTREQCALAFSSRLLSVGGTFSFTAAHRDFGYTTIWEAFAGELHDPQVNVVEKVHNAEQHQHTYRQGCAYLNALCAKQWNDLQLFLVPSKLDEKHIQHITINPEHVVNDAGETALDLWEQRELKRANGNVRSVAKRIARAISPEVALIQIADLMREERLLEMVQLPPGTLEHSTTDIPT